MPIGNDVGSGVGTLKESGVFVTDGTVIGVGGGARVAIAAGPVGFGASGSSVDVAVARGVVEGVAVLVGCGVRVAVSRGVGVRVGTEDTGGVGVFVGGVVRSPAEGIAIASRAYRPTKRTAHNIATSKQACRVGSMAVPCCFVALPVRAHNRCKYRSRGGRTRRR